MNHWTTVFILFISCYISIQALHSFEYVTIRQKRDAPMPNVNVTSPTHPVQNQSNNTKPLDNGTNPNTSNVVPKQPLMPNVTNPHLLGENGTGIRKDIMPNQPKVSDPIQPDDNGPSMSDIFKETPEKIKAELNISNIKYDNHTFYNSSFIGDEEYFKQYWANITAPKADIHAILSNSHRRATTLKLSFDFLFYGHPLRNITVATGGFIYMGDHVHSWLAATQYIAPLMANFDTKLTNDSFVKLYDDGTKFTALWENVTLQENKNKSFTFAVTLMKNGDIVFAYKNIPMPIKDIDDKEHPVKVGISDAYLTDKILFYVRRKTIYEYHRVSFLNHDIKSGTILKLVALPTCLQYDTCESCANHQTSFNCSWCAQIKRCSSGIDRNKQDWLARHCDKVQISNASECPVSPTNSTSINQTTSYVTDSNGKPYHDTVVKTGTEPTVSRKVLIPIGAAPKVDEAAAEAKTHEETGSSPIGGVVAAFITLTIISSMAAWVLYAFKNPHTRSGQLLIKYRPSQWSWKRGEARYTAATIHM